MEQDFQNADTVMHTSWMDNTGCNWQRLFWNKYTENNIYFTDTTTLPKAQTSIEDPVVMSRFNCLLDYIIGHYKDDLPSQSLDWHNTPRLLNRSLGW